MSRSAPRWPLIAAAGIQPHAGPGRAARTGRRPADAGPGRAAGAGSGFSPRQAPRNAPAGQRGQGLVEFALVSVLLIPLLVGFFDVGRAVYTNNSLASAARQGARFASINCAYQQPTAYYTTSSVTSYIQKQGWSLDLSKLQVSVSPSDGTYCPQPNVPITVTLTYHYVPVTPVAAQMASGGITLTGAATINSQ